MFNYLGEIIKNWRPLLAAFVGLGTGMSVVGVITSAIAPSLIAEMRWSISDYTMVHAFAALTALVFPFIGRLTDVLGVRFTALIGQATLPLCYLAYSQIGQAFGGDLSNYVVIFIVQSMLCVTTTATVYSRLAVQYVQKARGLALAIVVSGSSIIGILIGPLLNAYVNQNGWRDGFEAMAIFAAIGGLITFFLIPPSAQPTRSEKSRRSAREDYPIIFRSPAFWLLVGAMLLCNLPQTLLQVNIGLLVRDNGVSPENAGWMLSAPLAGMLTGRLMAGLALDRFKPHIVAFITLAIPSLGLYAIASSYDSYEVLLAAIFCVGFAFGAEGDIVAFLVARQFGVAIYSSVMGLMTAFISLSTSSGALLLGMTLKRNANHYDLFLFITGTTVLIGASFLLLFGRLDVKDHDENGLKNVFR